ncbi:MAG: TIGR03936 family radical SAM-associated protein [Oscillospiraceae bacterium]
MRIKFNKTGLSGYFSHLDLQRVMARALKKSGLPIWYSMGYNPHIYMTFALPLSLGHESICESCDFRLNEELSEETIISALKGTLPDGIEITAAGLPGFEAKDIRWAQYEITIFDKGKKVMNALESFINCDSALVTKTSKKSGEKQINLKEVVKELQVLSNFENETAFTALFPAGTQFNINPNLLLEFMQTEYEIYVLDANVLRQQLYNENLEILI